MKRMGQSGKEGGNLGRRSKLKAMYSKDLLERIEMYMYTWSNQFLPGGSAGLLA